MPRELEITTEIDVPAERVWRVMFDVERWHEWTPSIRSVRRLDEGPLAVGSRVVIHQPKFPPARWQVTEIEQGRSFTWESTGPGMRVVGYHAVEPREAGSRATLSIAHHGLLGVLLGRLTAGITRRYVGLEAKGLKARSEDPEFFAAPSTRRTAR